jgi:dUTPase
LFETPGSFAEWPLESFRPFKLWPGAFVLVETYEHITIPNGYCAELKLKSSMARQGFNHSLAFWVDPGWSGILTMEVMNATQYHLLELKCGERFAQLIIHRLDQRCSRTISWSLSERRWGRGVEADDAIDFIVEWVNGARHHVLQPGDDLEVRFSAEVQLVVTYVDKKCIEIRFPNVYKKDA